MPSTRSAPIPVRTTTRRGCSATACPIRQEHRLAPDPVAQAAGDQQQTAEHHGVGVDDPLRLGRGGVRSDDQGRQRDVQNGVVE
ncbi:hypothetical protein ABIA35_009514 [Catenulispora sp. MAP12-49]|uniref:hypothetical protein n=1 Tax=Catenulispora sp. MAP12-49 TaxID=3156302 RepID=UPI003515280B